MEMKLKFSVIKADLLNGSFNYKCTIKQFDDKKILLTGSVWDNSGSIVGTYQYNEVDDSMRINVKDDSIISVSEVTQFVEKLINDVKLELNN